MSLSPSPSLGYLPTWSCDDLDCLIYNLFAPIVSTPTFHPLLPLPTSHTPWSRHVKPPHNCGHPRTRTAVLALPLIPRLHIRLLNLLPHPPHHTLMPRPLTHHAPHATRQFRSGRYGRTIHPPLFGPGTVDDSEWEFEGCELRSQGRIRGDEGFAEFEYPVHEWDSVYCLVSSRLRLHTSRCRLRFFPPYRRILPTTPRPPATFVVTLVTGRRVRC